MKYILSLIVILFFSLILNLFLAYSFVYERNIEGEFPNKTFIYFYNDVVSIQENAQVGGWPLYWLVNQVDSDFTKEADLSVFDDIVRKKAFIFNWFYCFFLLYSLAGMVVIIKRFLLSKAVTEKELKPKRAFYIAFLALVITFYSSYFYDYKRDVEGSFPYSKSLSYYQLKDRKDNLLVGGFPFYHVVDNPRGPFTGKLDLIEWDFSSNFLFFSNFLLTFLVLLGMVNSWVRTKEKMLKLADFNRQT